MSLEYKVTIKSISVYMDRECDLEAFASSRWGCVYRPNTHFRCTYYDDDMTMNMYGSGAFIVFTYTLSVQEVAERVEKLVCIPIRKILLNNMAIRFDWGKTVSLEDLEGKLHCSTLDDVFMGTPTTTNDRAVHSYILDKQEFSPIRLRPWADKNIKVMVFDSGKVNVTGIKGELDILRVQTFVKESLWPLLAQCG